MLSLIGQQHMSRISCITYPQLLSHRVLGLPSFKQSHIHLNNNNVIIDWTPGSLKFNDSHTIKCHVQLRPSNVEVVCANAMARESMKSGPSAAILS
jgi:hypothetical protein